MIATNNNVKYRKVGEKYFHPNRGDGEVGEPLGVYSLVEEIVFRQGVKILQIAEIKQGKPCLVTEEPSGQISFLKLSIKLTNTEN